MKKETRDLLATPLVKRLVTRIKVFSQNSKFDLGRFAADLPAELKQGFAEIVLSEGEEDEEEAKKEFLLVREKLAELVLKERRADLTRQIMRLEREGDKKELDEVMHEFSEVSRKIANFKV